LIGIGDPPLSRSSPCLSKLTLQCVSSSRTATPAAPPRWPSAISDCRFCATLARCFVSTPTRRTPFPNGLRTCGAACRDSAGSRRFAVGPSRPRTARRLTSGNRRGGCAGRLKTSEASSTADAVRTSTALHRLWQNLTVEDQTLVDLRVNQGLTWVEIAHVLGPDDNHPILAPSPSGSSE